MCFVGWSQFGLCKQSWYKLCFNNSIIYFAVLQFIYNHMIYFMFQHLHHNFVHCAIDAVVYSWLAYMGNIHQNVCWVFNVLCTYTATHLQVSSCLISTMHSNIFTNNSYVPDYYLKGYIRLICWLISELSLISDRLTWHEPRPPSSNPAQIIVSVTGGASP